MLSLEVGFCPAIPRCYNAHAHNGDIMTPTLDHVAPVKKTLGIMSLSQQQLDKAKKAIECRSYLPAGPGGIGSGVVNFGAPSTSRNAVADSDAGASIKKKEKGK